METLVKFLENTWVKLTESGDDDYKLEINRRLLGGMFPNNIAQQIAAHHKPNPIMPVITQPIPFNQPVNPNIHAHFNTTGYGGYHAALHVTAPISSNTDIHFGVQHSGNVKSNKGSTTAIVGLNIQV